MQGDAATHRWDGRFLSLAREVAGWSKDPSTKVGCVVVREDRTIAAVGYNGFPRRVSDTPDLLNDRSARLLRTVHAEANAIVTTREDLLGTTVYVWPFPPCATCAGLIIQAGVRRVVSIEPGQALLDRWSEHLAASTQLFSEAGIQFIVYSNSALEAGNAEG